MEFRTWVLEDMGSYYEVKSGPKPPKQNSDPDFEVIEAEPALARIKELELQLHKAHVEIHTLKMELYHES